MPNDRVKLSLRIPRALADTLEESARDRKRSVNNLIEVILDMAMVEPPEPFTDEIDRRLT